MQFMQKQRVERRAGILSDAVKNAAPLVPALVRAGRISPNAAQLL